MPFGAGADLESAGNAAVKTDPFVKDRYPVIPIGGVPVDDDCRLVMVRGHRNRRFNRVSQTFSDAFELAVALTCQDTGLKQSEVAFFMRHSRPALRACYERIMESPPSPGMQILGRDRPNSPTCMVVQAPDPKGLGDPSRSNVADTSCFMSFRYVEIREAWSNLKFKSSDWGGKGEHPFFFVPKFHYGLVELAKEMDWIAAAYQDNIRIVIELSNLAVIVTESLKRAPEIRRGRQ
jgi:hypothetical protein